MLPAWPGPCVTCQTGSTPRSSKYRETDARSPPARPLPADGLRTRCASPPMENIARKYQNRSPAGEKPFKLDSRCRLRRKPAYTSQVEGTVPGRSPQRRDDRTETSMQVEEGPGLSRRPTEGHSKVPATIDFHLT